MTAAAMDRLHAHAVELACECEAISTEIERLTLALAETRKRECAIHSAIAQRSARLHADSHELAGILDGTAAA